MRLGVLFSGGKDSCFALYKAKEQHEIACLLTMRSRNKESYMFHTPNIDLTALQAEAMGIPLLTVETEGEKETELGDLKTLIMKAKNECNIHGIVTGAIESVYQAARIQEICNDLGLWCFNPLWKKDQLSLLNELRETGFKVIISGVFAYPLDKSFLGREIDDTCIAELAVLQKKFNISPSGEGGEIETLVLECPLFKRKLHITNSEKKWDGSSGIFNILEASLI
ncbi:MAG: diphthine--ammonia ligase [Nanoarchaeota archaeon]|nr:diphthine--ammonia ligase [Nanoarchaeota archaeon]